MNFANQDERARECAYEIELKLQYDLDRSMPDATLALATHCDIARDEDLPIKLFEALAATKTADWMTIYTFLADVSRPLAESLKEWRTLMDNEYPNFFEDELRNRRKGARAL